MNIQILRENAEVTKKSEDDVFFINPMANPRSWSEFDLSIFDFDNSAIYVNRRDDRTSINVCKYLATLTDSINSRENNQLIVVLPQEYTMRYDYNDGAFGFGSSGYLSADKLRVCINDIFVSLILPRIFSIKPDFLLSYENTTTHLLSVS